MHLERRKYGSNLVPRRLSRFDCFRILKVASFVKQLKYVRIPFLILFNKSKFI